MDNPERSQHGAQEQQRSAPQDGQEREVGRGLEQRWAEPRGERRQSGRECEETSLAIDAGEEGQQAECAGWQCGGGGMNEVSGMECRGFGCIQRANLRVRIHRFQRGAGGGFVYFVFVGLVLRIGILGGRLIPDFFSCLFIW